MPGKCHACMNYNIIGMPEVTKNCEQLMRWPYAGVRRCRCPAGTGSLDQFFSVEMVYVRKWRWITSGDSLNLNEVLKPKNSKKKQNARRRTKYTPLFFPSQCYKNKMKSNIIQYFKTRLTHNIAESINHETDA